MSDERALPALRVAAPILDDFAHIARRMRPDEIEQFLAFTGESEYRSDVAARALAMMTSGPTYAFVGRDAMPVVVCGFAQERPGVYEAWMAGTLEGWSAHGMGITRLCRRLIDGLLASLAHRVQVTALASRTQAHDWYVRGLGMELEALLRGYAASGADAIVFAKVRR